MFGRSENRYRLRCLASSPAPRIDTSRAKYSFRTWFVSIPLLAALVAVSGCGGTGSLTASIETPLVDVEIVRGPADGNPADGNPADGNPADGNPADAAPPAETAAPAAQPSATTITNTVGQDNAIVVTGDLTLALPPGVTLQEALQGVLHAPEPTPPLDSEPGQRDQSAEEADTSPGYGHTGDLETDELSLEGSPAPEDLSGRPDSDEPAGPVQADLYLHGVGEREGFSARRYCDGRWVAIGHGHLVVDPATGRRLLCEDWERALADAEWAVPAWLWDELDPVRRDVLGEIAYMTGRSGLRDFSDMNVALYQRDYARAAAQILASTLGCPANEPYPACLAEPNARRSYLAELMEAGGGAPGGAGTR